jgi:hypothetical protein
VTSPFGRPALIAVIGVSAVSLAVAVALTIAGGDPTSQRSAGADAYSVSAIGHQGLVRLLEKLDVPVIVSRNDSGDKARDGLLVVIEPTVTDDASRDRLKRLVDSAPRSLVVLPKWYGAAERGKAWIEDAHLLPVDEVTAVMKALGVEDPTLVRLSGKTFTTDTERNDLPAVRDLQLAEAPGLFTPRGSHTVGTSLVDGVKDRSDDSAVYVLSDPDVLSNFGLRAPANARFTINVLDVLREGGPIVIDETMHGYAQSPSLVRLLLEFPLVLATLQVVMCALLVVWAAMVRFGPRREAPPPLAPGKDFLIRNTAALLQYGGHHAHALRRYLQLTVAAVRQALHAPSLPPAAAAAWLEQVRKARGGAVALPALEQAVEAADTPVRTVEAADLVFRWRIEMTQGHPHGTDSRS